MVQERLVVMQLLKGAASSVPLFTVVCLEGGLKTRTWMCLLGLVAARSNSAQSKAMARGGVAVHFRTRP
jgi:hypothetical protein